MTNMINMIKKTKLLIIVVGVLFTACFDKAVAPPLEFDGEANMTIAEFQQLHTLSTSNPATLIDTNVIITGIVTSTDEFGSCYRELFFQDSTGGLSIRTANSSYFTKYRIGQRIFVKAKELYLGNYVSGSNTGFYQIALFGNGGMINIPADVENRHVFRSGVPVAPPAPKIITTPNDILDRDYHTLVKLTNCYFLDADGETRYFEPQANNSTIANCTLQFNTGGGRIIARVSAFTTFANDILPQGALNVTGLLTKFGNTPQLMIRSLSDVEILPDLKLLKSFDMTTNPFLEGWENKQLAGTDTFTYHPGSNARVEISSRNETECRLVSPKFNFSGEENVALFFTYRFLDGASENVQVLYTIDGTNWQPLDFTPQMGPTTEGVLKLNDHIATHPDLQIAFKYKTTTLFPIWMIRNIAFKANVM